MRIKMLTKQELKILFNAYIIRLYDLIKINNCINEKDFISILFDLLNKIREENDKITDISSHLLSLHKNIAIFSYSNIVNYVLKKKYDLLNEKILHIGECLPGHEGVLMAENCKEMGYNVILYNDVDFFSNADKYDVLLLGTELIYKKWILNKKGIYNLTIKYNKLKKPIYVLYSSSNILIVKKYKRNFGNIFSKELFLDYDLVPLKYITYVITDRRLYTGKELHFFLRKNII